MSAEAASPALRPTPTLDWDRPSVADFAREAAAGVLRARPRTAASPKVRAA